MVNMSSTAFLSLRRNKYVQNEALRSLYDCEREMQGRNHHNCSPGDRSSERSGQQRLLQSRIGTSFQCHSDRRVWKNGSLRIGRHRKNPRMGWVTQTTTSLRVLRPPGDPQGRLFFICNYLKIVFYIHQNFHPKYFAEYFS